jgi:hypothetical protein
VAGPGEVVVVVVAAPVLSSTNEVFDGTRIYHLTFPMTPGCGAVGRARRGPMRRGLRPASGCSATRRCVRATTRSRPTLWGRRTICPKLHAKPLGA